MSIELNGDVYYDVTAVLIDALDRERLALESALARDALARKEELRAKLGPDNFEDGDVLCGGDGHVGTRRDGAGRLLGLGDLIPLR